MGKDYKSSRRDEKDHGGRDRREDVDERDKEKNRDKDRERDKIRDKDRERDKIRDKDRVKDKDHGRERDIEKEHHERGREGKDRDRDRDADRDKERVRGKERDREKHKDREREKEKEKDKERDKTMREKVKGKDRDKDITDHEGKERSRDRDRDKLSVRNRDEGNDRVKDSRKDEKGIHGEGDVNTIERKQKSEGASDGLQTSTSQIKERILEMKEERLKKKSENVSEVLAWVNKSRKIEEKISSEKEKSLHRLKVLEEQDNIGQDESEDEGLTQHISKDLAGVKVLHGLDKVIEGGAVVLTLKDQSILADGDINEEIDMLENVEIGEQKQRDEAYRAAKKKTGIYTDKFNDDPFAEKKMLPQYDDPAEDEGITLDESGRFTGEAERKLEELRKRLEGSSTSSRFEDLNSTGKMTSDYYTSEEMLQFKKPKKKKSLRKKDKLDLDALEAEAISAGLGVADLGSRKDTKMQSVKEEQVRSDAQKRSDAYQSALVKAEEASKALRQEQFPVAPVNEDDNPIFGDDDEDLHKSLERARKLALKEQNETVTSVPQAVAALAIAKSTDVQVPTAGVTQEDKVVFTEMDEFIWGLQHDEETQKPEAEDVFMEDEEIPRAAVEEVKDDTGGWTEVNDANKDENLVNEKKEDIAPDETIHEVAVGKGLSGALQLLKERGTLKETVEWGGRNMDKKKSKLVGIYENDGSKEIQIERRDEFGRIMTPKEAFRMISHKFHGKGPGKMKQEKRMKQYQEEMKLKKMKNSDTPSESTERMREAQARMKTPYLVLSGHVKPGQTSDPRMGFSTAEDLPGGLTPMLGDRKVEHFLGIKRKADNSSMGPPAKKPTT